MNLIFSLNDKVLVDQQFFKDWVNRLSSDSDVRVQAPFWTQMASNYPKLDRQVEDERGGFLKSKAILALESNEIEVVRAAAWYLAVMLENDPGQWDSSLSLISAGALWRHPTDGPTWMAISAANQGRVDSLLESFLSLCHQSLMDGELQRF